jgi:hypothetical protein
MELRLNAKIQNDKIIYMDEGWHGAVQDFKQKNEGANIEVYFENVNSAHHYSYKYYWGYLLPDISFALGELDINRIHFELKRDFLYKEISNIDDIPKRYLKKGVFQISYRNLFSGILRVPFSMINGTLIVFENENITGYVPSISMKTFKQDEMREFIWQVEHRLFVDLEGQLGSENRDQKTAIDLRGKAGL